MLIAPMTNREIDALIVALKYWRAHRRDTRTRHNDPALTPEAVDLLLTKLRSATISSLGVGDSLARGPIAQDTNLA